MTHRATDEEDDHRVELARARERIAGLEARDAEHARNEPVQAALYRIAAAASGASDLDDFYRAIHAIVGELMDARNFYIALYDADRGAINFPYYVDTVDTDIPEPTRWEPFGVGNASGVTAYVLRNGQAIRFDTATWQSLVRAGEIGGTGAGSIEWLGAPLRHEDRTIGVIAVQTYDEGAHYEDRDVDVLVFVADHIASALARARAIEETRQRNAELALINEIGLALASDLDFHAIIELVGERLRTTMHADSIFIATVDNARGWLEFPYAFEAGGRLQMNGFPLGEGLTSRVVRERRPVRFGRTEETDAAGAVVQGMVNESWLGVPIIAGDDVIGVIVFEDPAKDAFDEHDERLLGTLASSMGVALQNAALFDETRRLLTETDERAAELAIINGVQQGLAAELDLQAMYELVGDKIQEIFDAQVVDIGIFDHERGTTAYPYAIERGVRYPDEPTPISTLSHNLIETGAPVRVDDVSALPPTTVTVTQGEAARSLLMAPLLGGGEVRGRISLQNLDKTHAFSDADTRLLSTIASSLGVALENVRLFDETKRLLTETDERAAELAIINGVQQGLAAELDLQAMYDLVGDKIREIFDAQVLDIAILDREANVFHFPYTIERGVRLPDEPAPMEGSIRALLRDTRQPILIERDIVGTMAQLGVQVTLAGEPPKSGLWVPLIRGDEMIGAISLQNIDREGAFDEGDVRLLSTIASSLSVALENARLIHETRQRVAELDTVNRVSQAISSQLDLAPLLELVGEQLRQTFRADIV